ncbi:MAG TPA: hypothetical protein VMV49_10280 [Candidatus Deferrimicrobium sp.]|nr:hypothetical protein [Candidatus Deferrimicrobium sp.]
MADIHNIFILKDGIPVFHVNPVRELIQNDQNLESKTKNLDSALIAGFLSAIASFAMEIGIGIPITYETSEMKFSFLSQSDFLFILGSSNVIDDELQSIIKKVADEFVAMILRGNLNVKTSDFSPFNEILTQILAGYIRKYDLLEESRLIEEYVQLIPQSHIIPETLEKLSETRRALFKLIDGEHSIYDISQVTKQHPRDLLSVLRSYTKSGLISIEKP